MAKTANGIDLWQCSLEEDGVRLDFTVDGYGEWVSESWDVSPASVRDAFVKRWIAEQPLDEGSDVLLEHLKASGDGVVRLVRKPSDWWELTLVDAGLGSIKSSTYSATFSINREHGNLVDVLQTEYCSELIEELVQDGYRAATRARFERARK